MCRRKVHPLPARLCGHHHAETANLAMRKIVFAACWALTVRAQVSKRLTLTEAEQLALQNHPRIASANLLTEAAKAVVTETRAPLYPLLSGNATAVAAQHGSTLAVGTIQTSSLFSRTAFGVSLTQLITDFGRTSNLIGAAKLHVSAQEHVEANARSEVIAAVDQAYYQALAADSVLKVANAVVENRRLTLRQVQALAQSELKSTLDVSFADVAVSEAELALYRAESDSSASRARLSAAIGLPQSDFYLLADEPLPAAVEPNAEAAVSNALNQRPDLAALRSNRDAVHRFARGESALSRPTISLLGTAGGLPATDTRLNGTYSAAGVNVSIPILNGKLYSARATEAELRAQAMDRDVEDLTLRIAEQVRVAWLEANTAFRKLDVTDRLVAQAERSLRLAQTRYDNGLGSIVELNQAQLAQVSAEIVAASAKYDYLSRRAALAFVTGGTR